MTLLTHHITLGRSRRDLCQSWVRFRSGRSDGNEASLLQGACCFYFLPAIRRVSLLVFLLVSATIEDKNFYNFKWLRP
jgi:hypothetical protein